MELKDSGKRQEFSTGSVRDVNTDKGDYSLLPTRAIRLLAQQFQSGCKKYGKSNWKLGQNLSRFLDSGLRHAFKHLEGHVDERHDISAAWNFMCLLETQELIKEGKLPAELDDLYEVQTGKKKESSHNLIGVDENFKPIQITPGFFTNSEKSIKQNQKELDKLSQIDKIDFNFKNNVWPDLTSFYKQQEVKSPFNFKTDGKILINGELYSKIEIVHKLMDHCTGRSETHITAEKEQEVVPTDSQVSNQDELSPEADKERLKRIDEELAPNYDEFRGMSYDQLIKHPIWKILAPIVFWDCSVQNENLVLINNKVYKNCNVDYKFKYDQYQTIINAEPLNPNTQELEWFDFSTPPEPNRELLLEINVKELQRFSPHFPVARYQIAYANTLDKSNYKRWTYLAPKFDQDQHAADVELKFRKMENTRLSNNPTTTQLVVQNGQFSLSKPEKNILPPKKEIE